MSLEKNQPKIGDYIEGGYYAGLVNIKDVTKAIIVAPKAVGENDGKGLKPHEQISGASCPVDGQQNTRDMIVAGVDVGLWAQSLNINGFSDWYIPSQVELDVIYRAFNENSHILAFKNGGPEAFENAWYRTSTQMGGLYVWLQHFLNGGQGYGWEADRPRARAIRAVDLSDLTI